MKKILSLSAVILMFFFINPDIQAKELCDCYGMCVSIEPRNVPSRIKSLVKIRDGFTADDIVEIDHKLPLCLGGTNDIDNLQALSPQNHKIKTENDMLLLYYIQNCFMTIEEAQEDALNPSRNFSFY